MTVSARRDGSRERLAARHVLRSAHLVTDAEAKGAYFGICSKCPRPVRAELPDSRTGGLKRFRIYCPDCGNAIQGERLFAVKNELECDASCMGAWGPQCSCGCSGANHGRHWALKLGESEILEHELERYREHRANVELSAIERELAKRRARRERPATPSALRYLRDLLEEREVPADLSGLRTRASVTAAECSAAIDRLRDCPKKESSEAPW